MITVVIKDNKEPKVIQLTYENLWRELKHIEGAKLVVSDNWLEALENVTTKYVCFVEPDCLVSSGYFDSMLGYIKKNGKLELNKLGILSSTTAVNNWAVRFYGYKLGNDYSSGVIPNKERKSTRIPFYTLQVAYVPGALLKTKFLKDVVKELRPSKSWDEDIVFFSTELSVGFWKHDWQVYIAPSPTYVTTEDYVNDIAKFDLFEEDIKDKFKRESI